MEKRILIKAFADENSEEDEECLAVAEQLLLEGRRALTEYTERARQGEAVTVKGAKIAVAELNAATSMFINERTRIADKRKQCAGIAGSYALDFGAARAEIGRRLACLRAAGDD